MTRHKMVVPLIGIDSSLPGSFGQFIMAALAVAVTLATITFVGGIPFLLGAAVLVAFSFSGKSSYTGIITYLSLLPNSWQSKSFVVDLSAIKSIIYICVGLQSNI